MGINLGPEYDLAKRISDLEKQVAGLGTRDVLQNASIGAGGLTITNGGTLTVDGDAIFNGSLTVPAGALSTAASISAGTFLTVGTYITAGTTITAAGTITSSGGNVTAAAGTVSGANISGSVGVTGADLFTQNGPGFNITAARVAGWLRNSDGLVATATSSRRWKTNIEPSNIDPEKILGLQDVHYQWTEQVALRDNIKPDHHVPTEIGLIAEEVHALGLWEFVVYERDKDDRLVLNDDGEPIPFAVHYPMLAVGLLPVLRLHAKQIGDLQKEIADLRGKKKR
jgi:Chaperone of endosialidase